MRRGVGIDDQLTATAHDFDVILVVSGEITRRD